MINALHLLWIIPLSGSFGAVIMALFAAAKGPECYDDDHDVSGLIDED